MSRIKRGFSGVLEAFLRLRKINKLKTIALREASGWYPRPKP
jgi:hypothetical protein